MKIAVVGLGKIGLPLAVQYASLGHNVQGSDLNESVVEAVNMGYPPYPGEEDLAEKLEGVVTGGLLKATTSTTNAVVEAEVIVVAVPLIIDSARNPDFSTIDGASHEIAEGLRPGSLVCYETTVPVGTTRARFKPLLERVSGLKCGVDFRLAFSPERVLTGRIFRDLRAYPKIIGGVDEGSAEAAAAFYSSVLDFDERGDLSRPNGVWDLGSSEAAELSKLMETTYRDVNIALANQFSQYTEKMGLNFNEIAEACNSQPYAHLHRPGIAVGGHCIPVYPELYLYGDPDANLVRAARSFNETMPARVIRRIVGELRDLQGLNVLVLGVSYRGGVKEHAFSGVFQLVAELLAAGANPYVHDPLYKDSEIRTLGLVPWNPNQGADVAILQAEHSEYLRWGPGDIRGIKLLYDGRSILAADRWQGVRLLGIGTA